MANLIPSQSSDFEGAGTGNWTVWFSCTLAKSTAQANAGTGSMEVTATGTSMGVTLNNFPGWDASGVAGTDVEISAAAFKADTPNRTVNFNFRWRDSGDTVIQTDTISAVTSAGTWVAAGPQTVAVPAGATALDPTITWSGSTSDIVYVDTIVADDAPGGGATDVTPDSATHAHTADEPVLTQVHAITVDSADHAHTSDSPTVDQSHQVTPDDSSHAHAAGQPAITQVHVITPSDALHAHTAGQPTVTEPADTLVNLGVIPLAPVLGHGPVTVEMLERQAAAPVMVERTALAPAMLDREAGDPVLGHGDTDAQLGHGDTEVALGHGTAGEPTT